MIPIEHNYNSLFLKPRKAIVNSRSECDTSVILGNNTFSMPIIPANMSSVVDENTCKYLAERGYFYVMHRFGDDIGKFIINMKQTGLVSSISVGVNEYSYDVLKKLKVSCNAPDYITIDIAHCWSKKGEKMIKFIKDLFPDTFLIAGNSASGEAVSEIESWGADCTKLFIGPGKVCTTRLATGFTRGTVDCLLECSKYANKPIIADGGIREAGDIAKAINLGATMVMAGSIFSGFDESAGNIVEIKDKKYKEYFGSSTFFSKGKDEHIEGKKIFVDYKGSMGSYLKYLEESLRSSISYGGGNTLSCLKDCERFFIDY